MRRLGWLRVRCARCEPWWMDSLRKTVGRLWWSLVQKARRSGHMASSPARCGGWRVACLAVISAGGVVVPLDAQLGDEALSHTLADSGARCVFTTTEQVGRLENVDAGLRAILLDVGEDDGRSWRYLLTDEDVDLPPIEAGDGAALFYTSGTTGAAKGVPLSHANLVFQIESLLGADLVSEE